MKVYLISIVATVLVCGGLGGEVSLTYTQSGEEVEVDGFELSRPYSKDGDDKRLLPLEGDLGLEIVGGSLGDNGFYPTNYKISRIQSRFAERSSLIEYSEGLDHVELPVTEKTGAALSYATYWSPSDFKNSLLVFGFCFLSHFDPSK